MISIMDKCELFHYKELSLHKRINDKQDQLVHLAKVCAYDHLEVIDYINTLSKTEQKEVKSYLKEDSNPPY